MHSVLENDGIVSDPYEVLCCMGTLIVEGRTPRVAFDSTSSSDRCETQVAKTVKAYNEGPHCQNHLKIHSKDLHKCTENNILCIRYNNLRQSLQYLRCTSSSIAVEVSLGPDCLCGELRSQSTLFCTQPSKRDAVLEQWMITIDQKKFREPPSQMSVLNLYQAVRSLLHFSQLTAWYASTNGTKPSCVIYRVASLEDAAYVADGEFVNHDLPMVDINKAVSMKISLKTLPRREKIPTVFCLQHSPVPESSGGSRFDNESQCENDFRPGSKSPSQQRRTIFDSGEKNGESMLPLKFQGVRKKTDEAQERKRKAKNASLYGVPELMNGRTGNGILDGIPVDVQKGTSGNEADPTSGKRTFLEKSLESFPGESSEAEFKKSKSSSLPKEFSDLVKTQNDFESFRTFSCNYFEQKMVNDSGLVELVLAPNGLGGDSKRKKGDFGSSDREGEAGPERKTAMEILDDRMQISCAISGKHHCDWECEEESESRLASQVGGNAEKPKRRRSLSRAKSSDVTERVKPGISESEKVILHGKFKEVDSVESMDFRSKLEESQFEKGNESEKSCATSPEFSPRAFHSGSPRKSAASAVAAASAAAATITTKSKSQTPKIEGLPLISETSEADEAKGSSQAAEERKIRTPKGLNRIQKKSFESFRRGCAMAARDRDFSDSGDEGEDEGQLSETSNPFLAAILRSTKKSPRAKRDSKNPKKCDNSLGCSSQFAGEEEGIDRGEKSGKWTPSTSCSEGLGKEKGKVENPFKSYLELKMEKEFDAESKSISCCCYCCSCTATKNSNPAGCHRRKKSAAVKRLDEKALESISSAKSKSSTDRKKEVDCEESSNPNVAGSLDEGNIVKTIPVPSAHDKLKFRRSLDSAAQLVFHRCSGLPLTSSPAPVRRNNSSFSFDSTLNSVSAIKSALFEPANSLSSEDENESEGSLKSPASPGAWSIVSKQINYHSLSPLPLLGSFEESVLNGRLEPVSTVHGFTAELGASGSFCPRHLHLPVTVFFYTLGDNDKVSAPYLGHINLGKKGYNVPRSGTIQVTLFNPLRTVVKMFVVVYDLTDMPVNSQTFLRQRTLYVPASVGSRETPFDRDRKEDHHKYLRYLIHLRFVSGKSGRIYLHTDIRMVIFRKADEDTATALGKKTDGETYELRSHTHGPVNPKFSPRK